MMSDPVSVVVSNFGEVAVPVTVIVGAADKAAAFFAEGGGGGARKYGCARQ